MKLKEDLEVSSIVKEETYENKTMEESGITNFQTTEKASLQMAGKQKGHTNVEPKEKNIKL